jgi:VCBS repeat-containing protein
LGFTQYTFDVVGDGSSSTTQFLVDYATNGSGLHFDQFSVSPTPGPATETTEGAVHFTDVDPGDTHTASFTPQDNNYVGTFSLDPVSESGGSGSVEWHFSVNNADIQFLAQGQALTQVYTVAVTDAAGASSFQDISVTLNGTNDAPTAVNDTVVTDAGASGTIDIPTFALALNDTDPDTTDHVSVSHVVSSSGGSTTENASDVFFFDDATPGGSFDYAATDGIATSANNATATIINNATSSTTLTAGSGDSILIATNGSETLQGGAGNDVLIGNSGSHTMSGGGGNDTFAFLHTSDGLGMITDFNNTTEHDHIAVSASGYGGPLTAGMDVSSIFQTTADNQTNGIQGFLFDTGNQTLYYSADGTQGAQIALAQVQAGVTVNPHDLLIV